MSKIKKFCLSLLFMIVVTLFVSYLIVNKGYKIRGQNYLGYVYFVKETKFTDEFSCNKGIIKDDEIIFEAKYDEIIFFDDLVFLTCRDKVDIYHLNNLEKPFMKSKGKITNTSEVIVLQTKNKDYLFDREGNKIEMLEDYDTYMLMDRSFVIGKEINEKMLYGVIDLNGNVLLEPSYDEILDISFNQAVVKKDNLFGVVDLEGKLIVPIQHHGIELNEDNLRRIVAFNELGYETYYDHHGNIVEPFHEFPRFYSKYQNLLIVNKDNKYGVVDDKDQLIIEYQYDYIDYFYREKARFKLNNKWGYLDKTGNVLIESKYDYINDYRNGYFVRNGSKWGLLDLDGNVVAEIIYDEIKNSGAWVNDKDYLIAKLNGNQSLINHKGEVIIDFDSDVWNQSYEYMQFLHDGIIYVYKDGKYRLVNYQNEPLSDDYVGVVISNGIVRVEENGKYGVFDQQKNKILDIKYDQIGLYSDQLLIVKTSNDYGAFDYNGNLVIDINYDQIYTTGSHFYLEKDGAIFFTDKSGDLIKLKSRYF